MTKQLVALMRTGVADAKSDGALLAIRVPAHKDEVGRYFFLERDFLSAFTSFFAKLAAFLALLTANFACARLAFAALTRARGSSFGDSTSVSEVAGSVSLVSCISCFQGKIPVLTIPISGRNRHLM